MFTAFCPIVLLTGVLVVAKFTKVELIVVVDVDVGFVVVGFLVNNFLVVSVFVVGLLVDDLVVGFFVVVAKLFVVVEGNVVETISSVTTDFSSTL